MLCLYAYYPYCLYCVYSVILILFGVWSVFRPEKITVTLDFYIKRYYICTILFRMCYGCRPDLIIF